MSRMQPGENMTPQEKDKLGEALDRIEHQPEQIFVRRDNRNVPLLELPTIEALRFVCKWIRRYVGEAQ